MKAQLARAMLNPIFKRDSGKLMLNLYLLFFTLMILCTQQLTSEEALAQEVHQPAESSVPTEAQADHLCDEKEKLKLIGKGETEADRGHGARRGHHPRRYHMERQYRGAVKPIRQIQQKLIPPRQLLKLTSELGLSADQKVQLEHLVSSGKAEMKTKRDTKKQRETELSQAFDKWSKSAINSESDEALLEALRLYSEAERDWREGRLKIALRARRVLSLAQIESALNYRDQRKERERTSKHAKEKKKGRGAKGRLRRLEERLERLEKKNKRDN